MDLTNLSQTIFEFDDLITPDDIIESYGFDAVRLSFFNGDLNKDLIWNINGLDGAWRFIRKVWTQIVENLDTQTDTAIPEGAAQSLHHITQQSAANFMRYFDKGQFNLCVARLYELSHAIDDFKIEGEIKSIALHDAVKTLIQLMAPITPHLSHEAWSLLGEKGSALSGPLILQ